MRFDIPVFGTMAHSFIMSFEDELEAFRQFQNLFPSSFLLVDTYDTLNAIRMIIKERISLKGIRLDSGDLLYLSKEARKLLDETGESSYLNVKIMASNDLNEYIIQLIWLRIMHPLIFMLLVQSFLYLEETILLLMAYIRWLQ